MAAYTMRGKSSFASLRTARRDELMRKLPMAVHEAEGESTIEVIARDLRLLRRGVDCLTLLFNINSGIIDEIAARSVRLVTNWRAFAVRSPMKNKFVAFLLCLLYS